MLVVRRSVVQSIKDDTISTMGWITPRPAWHTFAEFAWRLLDRFMGSRTWHYCMYTGGQNHSAIWQSHSIGPHRKGMNP